MSQENQSKPRNNSEGQRRQSGNNNRNNNRNRNKNRNRQGGQGGNSQKRRRPNSQAGGPKRQGRQSGGGPRKRQPKPVPLTLWEKILNFFGLYKSPTRPPRRKPADSNLAAKAAKSNTRNARSTAAQDKGIIKAKGRGAGASGRDFPVETPRLYLGNLSYDATEQDLEDLFRGVGTVRGVDIIYNRHTHRSKGYGFIEMYSVEEAKRAVEELHDKPFMGRNLIVNGAKAKKTEDKPLSEAKSDDSKSSRPKAKGKKNQPRGDKRSSAVRLQLENISAEADQSSLEDHFKGIGNVRRVDVDYDRDTHKPKGTGYVEMQKAEDAQRAVEVLHDQPFMGTKLQVIAPEQKSVEEAPAEETPEPAAEKTSTSPETDVESAAEPAAESASEPATEQASPAKVE